MGIDRIFELLLSLPVLVLVRSPTLHTMVLGALLNLVLGAGRFVGNILYVVLGAVGLRRPLWELFTYMLTHHRTWIVMFFVLPMSVFFDVYWRVRTWWITVVNVSLYLFDVCPTLKKII